MTGNGSSFIKVEAIFLRFRNAKNRNIDNLFTVHSYWW